MLSNNDSKLLVFNHEIKRSMILCWLAKQDADTHTNLRMFYAIVHDCPMNKAPYKFEDDQSLDFVWQTFSSKIKTLHRNTEKQRKKKAMQKKIA